MPRSVERDHSRGRDRERRRDDERRRPRSRDRDDEPRDRHRRRDSRDRDIRDDRRERPERKSEKDDDNYRRKPNRWESGPSKAFNKRPDDKAEEQIPWGGFPTATEQPEKEPVEKELPSLKPSGKLLEDTNMVNGTVVKYVEPAEAKLPRHNWQLHPFRNAEGKDPEPLPVMHIHRRSCFLIGRDRKVVQFPMDHPSCSKQHAALQFRSLTYTREDGEKGRRTRPYLIDLQSSNGSFINDEKIEPTRYYELKHGDEIKFGFSSRSFVILNATAAMNQTKDEASDEDDEVEQREVEPAPLEEVKKEETEGEKFEI